MYKPTYCCECGERIERTEWHLLTNRRFCQLCETEFKLEDLVRKLGAGVLVLVGLLGFGSYLSSGDRNLAIDTSKRLIDQKSNKNRGPASKVKSPSGSRTLGPGTKERLGMDANAAPYSPNTQRVNGKSGETPPKAKQRLKPQKVTADPVYFCGASTKKGDPCSRKVKGGGRCWQHEGQKALLTDKELQIKD